MNRFSALIRQILERPPLIFPVRTQWQVSHPWSSRTVRNKYLLFKPFSRWYFCHGSPNKLKYELPKTLPFPAWAWLMIFLSNKRFTNHLFFSLMPCPKVFRSYFRLGAKWHSTLFFFPSLVNKPFSLFNLPVLFPTHRYAYSLRVNIFSVYT